MGITTSRSACEGLPLELGLSLRWGIRGHEKLWLASPTVGFSSSPECSLVSVSRLWGCQRTPNCLWYFLNYFLTGLLSICQVYVFNFQPWSINSQDILEERQWLFHWAACFTCPALCLSGYIRFISLSGYRSSLILRFFLISTNRCWIFKNLFCIH